MSASAQHLRLAQLFAAAVLGEWDTVRALRRAAPAGEPDRAWRETVLQVHVFAGFPRGVETYGVLAEEGGLGELGPDERLAEPEHFARADALFERIYADHAPRVRTLLHDAHPDFARWILGHAYGRVLTRPGLSAAQRELLAVVALAALGQERQLASHLRGAVRCGATPADLSATLESVRTIIGPTRCDAALALAARYATP
jgi:4-carboxymuconolactone decarboxylase